MSNSTEQIPSGATHKTPKGTYMKCVMGNWFEWLHEWVEVGRRVSVDRLTEIERQDVSTAADIDWSRQDVPEGATHYQRACAATRNTARYFKDDFNKAFVLTHPENGWIDFPKEQLTPEAYANMLTIPTKPAPKVDWSKAPEGATHAAKFRDQWGFVFEHDIIGWMVWGGEDWFAMKLAAGEEEKLVKRPESITDVARTIEAARMAEKSGNRCATCTANICSVIDDCYAQRAKEESARIEEQACMPWPDGDARYFETSDVVNNPAHYTTGGIECIDAMQAMLSREEFIGYLRGNIFKYQWRYKHKNGVEDLRKADWCAQRLIRVEGEK